MAETFHQFGLLPAELRIKIWELAIRPTVGPPGAHIFGTKRRPELAVGDLKHGDYYSGILTVPVSSHVISSSSSYAAAADACEEEEDDDDDDDEEKYRSCFNPATENWSTYLIDWGLWMACKESRWLIKRAFDRKISPPCTLYFEEVTVEDGLDPETSESSAVSKSRHLTVFPERDLFCLNRRYDKDVSEVLDDLDDLLSTIEGLEEVALDFDLLYDLVRREWSGSRDAWKDVIKEFVDWGCNCTHWNVTVWFIDNYAAVPVLPRVEDWEGRWPYCVFQATDRRFVELRSRGLTRCKKFVSELESEVETVDFWATHDSTDDYCKVMFGVLAWEYT